LPRGDPQGTHEDLIRSGEDLLDADTYLTISIEANIEE
jgi:hypothetical protein